MLKKIISGGQTGVDRAALDVALDLGIPCSGWCPKGRRADDGVIPDRYPLQETKSKEYPVRTKQNVLDSDATLIVMHGKADRGTALTIRLAEEHGKPHWVVDLAEPVATDVLVADMRSHDVEILNVAGPRESSSSGIHERASALLRDLFEKYT